MAEPLTIMAILGVLKAIGLKTIIAKVTLAIKGASVLHGKAAILAAKQALVAAKAQGLVEGAKMIAQMLIILGTFAAGTAAASFAIEALKAAAEGDFETAFNKARKSVKEAKPIDTVWFPS